MQGKSRAPTFILAFLIYVEKMKLKDGLALLREYVNEVEPNESFMQQLADYDLDQLSKNAFGKWEYEQKLNFKVLDKVCSENFS